MTKHRTIFETLQAQIASGKFANAPRLPSETELARKYGVSRPTAARALRDLQALGLLERRVGSGTYMRPPQKTSTDRALTIGLLVPGLGHTEILEPICGEISRIAQQFNASTMWAAAPAAPMTSDQAKAACQQMIDRNVDGVVFAPLEHVVDRAGVNTQIAETLAKAGIAVVLLDRDVVEFPRRSRFDLIGIDNFHAAFVLAEHLVSRGRKRFRFVARPQYPGTTDLRMAGCREALLRRGLSVDSDWARFGDPSDEKFVRSLLRPKPDAIICANDLTAALLMQSLAKIGVRLPEQVSIAGFDDVKYATLLSVTLTTIRQPCPEIAKTAMEMMIHRMRNPTAPVRQVLLDYELVVRQSSGKG